MSETIKLEARYVLRDLPAFSAGLRVTVIGLSDTAIEVTGDVFELACLVERHETGNWSIPLDEAECGHDHVRAQQRIDQYTI